MLMLFGFSVCLILLPVCTYFSLCVCLSHCLSLSLSVRLYLYLPLCLSLCLSLYLLSLLSVCMSFCLSLYFLSIYRYKICACLSCTFCFLSTFLNFSLYSLQTRSYRKRMQEMRPSPGRLKRTEAWQHRPRPPGRSLRRISRMTTGRRTTKGGGQGVGRMGQVRTPASYQVRSLYTCTVLCTTQVNMNTF